jgi:hypothetical protein
MDTTKSNTTANGDLARAPTALGPAASRATLLGALVALAGIGTAAALAIGDAEMRRVFIFGYLVAFAYYLSITLGAQFFVLVQHLCRAGWSVTLRRLAEAMMGNLGLLAVLFVPVALGMADLYPWARPASAGHEPLFAGKAAYLSPAGFLLRFAACFAVWGFLAWFLRNRSIGQDADRDPRRTRAMERIAGPGTIAFCIATTVAAFDLLMSLDPHWYSTVFGIHYFAGSALGAVVVLTLLSLWLQRNAAPAAALAAEITEEHYHDLGKLMFAGVCFWGYIALCQYLLAWYSNLPEETRFLIPRQIGPWITVSAVLAACHLFIPFAALLSRYAKRRRMLLAFCGVWLLAAHAMDLFWLVMPNVFLDRIPAAVGAPHGASLPAVLAMLVPSHQSIYQVSAQHADAIHGIGLPLQPRALAIVIGLVVGMGGVYWVSTVRLLGRASLVPVGDPRLAESIAFENT